MEETNWAELLDKKSLEPERFNVLLLWRATQGTAITSLSFGFEDNILCPTNKDDTVS